MKKLMIAAMFLFCVGGTVLAQTAPKQEPPKQEKKTTTAPKQEAPKQEKKTTTTKKSSHSMKHHSKKSDKKTGSKQG